MSEKKATKAVDNKFAAFIKENLGIMVALAVMCIFLAVFPATSSSFLTPKNMFNILSFVHAFSGVMAGLAGIILASRMYSGQPTAGEGAEMDAIAAVVVGGTSMSGGSGKIGGTVIGALIIGILNNGLNLLNVNSFWQDVVKGIVILLAVLIDYFRTNKK